MAGLVPAISLHVARPCPPKRDARVKCSARTHSRRVFGDIADTSSLHGLGCLGGHPCHGERRRSWTSGVSSLSLQGRKGRTGGSFAAGSGFTRTPVTSGLAAG